MKKLLAVLLALVMLVSLAACADNTDKDNPSSDAPANSDNPSMKANVCCRATATDASAYRFRTYMISDMLGTNTKEINDFHLAEMTKYFAKAISSDEVCERLKNGVF